MAYSVKAHAVIDGHNNRMLEFHRVCSVQTLEKLRIGEPVDTAQVRLKVLAALFLEELHCLKQHLEAGSNPAEELQHAYDQTFSAYLHAMSALSQPLMPNRIVENARVSSVAA